MREGRCHGGPLDGQVRISRYPSGFLLGDKSTGRAWFYDWRDGAFHVRDPDSQPLTDDLTTETALGEQFDVFALPGDADGR